MGSKSVPFISREQLSTLGNTQVTLSGRRYSGHALDRMQNSGIPASAVENTIKYGRSKVSSRSDTDRYYDVYNNVTVITDSSSGNVVSVFYGGRGAKNL